MDVFRYSAVPQGFGGLLGDSLRLFRVTLTALLPLGLLGGAVLAAPTLLFGGDVPWRPGMPLPEDAGLRLVASALASMVGIALVGSLLLRRMDAHASGVAEDLGESLRSALAAVPPVLLGMLLVFLCGVAAALGVGLVAFVVALLSGAGEPGGSAYLFGVAAGVMAVLLMLVLVVRLGFMQPAVVLAGAGGVAALRMSWQATRGHALRVAAVLAVVAVFWLIWSLIVSFAAGLLAAIAAGVGSAGLARGLSTLVTVALEGVYTQLAIAAVLVLWGDLRLRARPAVATA